MSVLIIRKTNKIMPIKRKRKRDTTNSSYLIYLQKIANKEGKVRVIKNPFDQVSPQGILSKNFIPFHLTADAKRVPSPQK